jgi:hypothetical protein
MILAIEHSNVDKGIYAIYDDELILKLYSSVSGEYEKLVSLPKVNQAPIKMYFHYPYICVSERYGLNAAVVNIEDKEVRCFTRDDDCFGVSSYSIGFVKHGNSSLLIHQTKFNRLDITNLETGELLTDREIYQKEIARGHNDGQGNYIPPKYDKKNFISYFHSLLHISPDYRSFLSNGWHWHPFGNIMVFSVIDFLSGFELGGKKIEPWFNYNWDHPCTYIDDNSFVIVDSPEIEVDDEDNELPLDLNKYYQFKFYHIDGENNEYGSIIDYKRFHSDVFPLLGEDGDEIYGELWFDETLKQLIALNHSGAYGLDLDGNKIWHKSEIEYTKPKEYIGEGISRALPCGWQYSKVGHCFYRYNHDENTIEEVFV